MSSLKIPATGFKGLTENFSKDLTAGFILSLIALPLCLGIASASNFPPAAGLIAAIIGGVLVSRFSGAFVTINGPAAGLISVNAAAVMALGHGNKEAGYPLALAAIVVSGALIFLLGMVRAGKLASLVPSNAVHGMLAAIGVIIISKQIHPALGVKPAEHEPLPLLAEIPHSFAHLHQGAALVAAVSFFILIIHPYIKWKVVKMIPAPLWVMAVAIPLAQLLHLDGKLLINLDRDPSKAFVAPDFSAIGTGAFWVAVMSITLVTALETVLSATAVDKLDPFRRKSDLSRDMAAMGVGSAASGAIGGLPMIAEIVRSSANINNGARTQWSNFFHGLFLAVFMVLLVPMINLIPVSALAAMLVFTGLRLASPKSFTHALHLGADQLIVMLTTVIVTLATDLLFGIAAGILMQLAINFILGSEFSSLFRSSVQVEAEDNDHLLLRVNRSSIFSNYLSMLSKLTGLPGQKELTLDLSGSKIVDSTVMENLHEFGRRYEEEGGKFAIVGLDSHKSLAHHPLAGRVKREKGTATAEQTLNSRQQALHNLANRLGAQFRPEEVPSMRSLAHFPLLEKSSVESEGNRIIGQSGAFRYEMVDLNCRSGFGAGLESGRFTAVLVQPIKTGLHIPSFCLEPEAFLDDLWPMSGFHDIDFAGYPGFSERWLLRGPEEDAIRQFFNDRLMRDLESREGINWTVVSDGRQLLFHCGGQQLNASEAESLLAFGQHFASLALT